MRKLISMIGSVFVGGALLAAMVLAAPFAGAQEGTPESAFPEGDGELRAEVHAYPAHIHSGTCDELGDVVYPIEDLRAVGAISVPDVTPELEFSSTPEASDLIGPQNIAAHSSTEVDVSLEDLLAGEYAINVHASAENIDVYVACGEITGTAEDGELIVELNEVETSGYEGLVELSDLEATTTFVNAVIYPDNPPSGTAIEATPAD